MSQENVDMVRASIAAYNAGDVDGLLQTYLPSVVAVMHGGPGSRLPDVGDRIEGRAVLGRWMTDTLRSWHPRYEASEVRDLEGGAVLCRGRLGGAGAATSIELSIDTSVLFRLRSGLIDRMDFYDSHAEALKAVGLEE